MKKHKEKRKRRSFLLKHTNKISALFLLLLGTSAITPIATSALDTEKQQQFSSFSILNMKTNEFEYSVQVEDNDNFFGDGYELEKDMSPISGKTFNNNWNGWTNIYGLDGRFTYTMSFTGQNSGSTAEAYPYSWNGTTQGAKGATNTRMSASGTDYQRAEKVVNNLTSELNRAISYIVGDIDKYPGSVDDYLKDLRDFSNNVTKTMTTGESTTGAFGTCSSKPTNGEYDSKCFPYTLKKPSSNNDELIKAIPDGKTTIAKTDDSFIEDGAVGNTYKDYIVIQKHINGIGSNKIDYSDSESVMAGKLFISSIPKGYNNGEVLHSALLSADDKFLTKPETTDDLKDMSLANMRKIGVTNHYTWGMMIGQALYIYTAEGGTIKSAADFEEFAMKQNGSDEQGIYNNWMIKLIYSITGARLFNEVISPFENGMTYGWVGHFLPIQFVPVAQLLFVISVVLFVVLLILMSLIKILNMKKDPYNSEMHQGVDFFKDLLLICLFAFLNVVLIPFYVGIGRALTSIFVLGGTPPGYAPGTYEIGGGLMTAVPIFNIGWQIAFAAMASSFYIVIVFAYFQIALRFALGPIFAIGFITDQKSSAFNKFMHYHASLMWIAIAKFGLYGFGYMLLAQLQYKTDLPPVLGLALMSMVLSLPAMIQQMLGLKFSSIPEGAMHAAAAVGATNGAAVSKINGAKSLPTKGAAHVGQRKYDKNEAKIKSLKAQKDIAEKNFAKNPTPENADKIKSASGQLSSAGAKRVKQEGMAKRFNAATGIAGALLGANMGSISTGKHGTIPNKNANPDTAARKLLHMQGKEANDENMKDLKERSAFQAAYANGDFRDDKYNLGSGDGDEGSKMFDNIKERIADGTATDGEIAAMNSATTKAAENPNEGLAFTALTEYANSEDVAEQSALAGIMVDDISPTTAAQQGMQETMNIFDKTKPNINNQARDIIGGATMSDTGEMSVSPALGTSFSQYGDNQVAVTSNASINTNNNNTQTFTSFEDATQYAAAHNKTALYDTGFAMKEVNIVQGTYDTSSKTIKTTQGNTLSSQVEASRHKALHSQNS